MDIVRDAVRLLAGIFRVVGWLLATARLGVATLWWWWRFLSRLGWLFAERRYCPRGHRVPMYGYFQCACGAVMEGWVFGRCDVCGDSCGWTPCTATNCGLPIRNPLL